MTYDGIPDMSRTSLRTNMPAPYTSPMPLGHTLPRPDFQNILKLLFFLAAFSKSGDLSFL